MSTLTKRPVHIYLDLDLYRWLVKLAQEETNRTGKIVSVSGLATRIIKKAQERKEE